MKKFIIFLSVLCILGFTYNIAGAAYTQGEVDYRTSQKHSFSQPYDTFDACQSDVVKFNKLSPNITRTKCDIWQGAYYYFSCNAGTNCEYKGESITPKPQPTQPDVIVNLDKNITKALDNAVTHLNKTLSNTQRKGLTTALDAVKINYINDPITYAQVVYLIDALDGSSASSGSKTPGSGNTNQNTGGNQAVNACIGSLPSGNGVMSTGIEGKDSTSTTWTYTNLPSSYQCTWTCASGYQKNGNGCVLSNSGSQNQSGKNNGDNQNTRDVQVTLSGTEPLTCQQSNSTIRWKVYFAQGTDTICTEYTLKNGTTYTCDSDSKFTALNKVYPSGNYDSGWGGTVFLQNNTSKIPGITAQYFVPGTYKILVKDGSGHITTSNSYTIASQGEFSYPDNCNYKKQSASSMEEALWIWVNSPSDFNPLQGIDWENITSSCSATDMRNKMMQFLIGGYTNNPRNPTYGGYGYPINQAFINSVSSCFSRTIPTWTGSTFYQLGVKLDGEKNNVAEFDFQSWYQGGNPWKLGGVACGLVPNHAKSQIWGGITWEKGKTFDCAKGTYGGTSTGGNTTPPGNQGNNGSAKQCEGTAPSGPGIKLNGANALDVSPIRPYWDWVYGTVGHCTWYCDTGYERSGNSCVLKTSTPPATGNTNFSVTTSKTKLKHTNDSINVTITGANNLLKVCNRILHHPNGTGAPNLDECKKKSDFIPLSSASGWTYSNGVWIGKINSNASVAPIGLKWKVFFMMDDDLSKRKWTADLEVIN